MKWLDQLASFECVKRVCCREPETDSPPGQPKKREGADAEGQPGKKFQGGGDGSGAHVQEGGGRQQQKQQQGGKGGKPYVSSSGGADYTVHARLVCGGKEQLLHAEEASLVQCRMKAMAKGLADNDLLNDSFLCDHATSA